jgi:hypothetical protein
VKTFPIFDFRLPIDNQHVAQAQIGNRQSPIGNPKKEGVIKNI